MLTSSVSDARDVLPFPKLMITKEGTIVLFADNISGTVLVTTRRSVQPIGYYSDGWALSCFHDFYGTVTLEN
jgi:hypothetical protein